MDTLHVALGLYPHTREIHDRPVPLDAHTELVAEPLFNAGGFGPLLEDEHFDVFEIPVVSLAVAQQQGIQVAGTSIVITRRFHHSRLVWNLATGISGPSDLVHRRAGLRYHGFTDATWARGILSHDFGLDPNEVTWVTVAPETVPSAPLPENVSYEPDVALEERLRTGELAMLILNARQQLDDPGVEAVFADPVSAEDDWFRRTGVVPINHVIAIRQRALELHPNLAEQLTDAFARAKAAGLAGLGDLEDPDPEEESLIRVRELLGADPLPYGLDENRPALEMILRFAAEQRVLVSPTDLSRVFIA